jgi:hypothetical protein
MVLMLVVGVAACVSGKVTFTAASRGQVSTLELLARASKMGEGRSGSHW